MQCESVIILISWLLAGVSMVADSLTELHFGSKIVEDELSMFIIGTFLVAGSTGAVLSSLPWRRLSTGWQLEKFGLPVLVAGWMGFTFFSIVNGPWLFPIFIGIAGMISPSIRFVKVSRIARRTRHNVRTYEKRQGLST